MARSYLATVLVFNFLIIRKEGHMGRERTGSVRIRDGKIYARVVYFDETGKKREVQKIADTIAQAKKINKQILGDLEGYGANILDGSKMTFKDLADYCLKHYFKEAEYAGDIKVSGHRGHKSNRGHFKPVVEYFGHKTLQSIRWADIAAYRTTRLKTATQRGTPRAIATVNRELAQLRRALQIAKQQGWIKQNPFTQGDTLISIADEKKRERILTKEEETRLLEACTDRKAHLRLIIICALDTGMRAGEIFKLKWKDINWQTGLITIQAFHTKTFQERQVAMTKRLEKELWELWALSSLKNNKPDVLVFGITTDCKHSFINLRRAVGLDDVRFHDLRHTAATRMIEAGIPLQQVGRVLGHSQAQTTFRYINLTVEAAKRAATALDKFNEKL